MPVNAAAEKTKGHAVDKTQKKVPLRDKLKDPPILLFTLVN
jgi:hypothetical protein